MKHLYSIVQWSFCILIFIIYYKSSMSKMRHPYAFTRVLKEYRFITNEILLMVLAPCIIIAELLAGVWIVIPSTRYISTLIGISLQLLYIIIISANNGKKLDNSCACFELNVPSNVTTKSIVINICLLFVFFVVISLQKELGGFKWSIFH